jgi:glycogen debranching enzyme
MTLQGEREPAVDPARVWEMGYRALCSLESPYGFDASERDTGLYATPFGRDSLWITLFLLDTLPLRRSETFRDWVAAAGARVIATCCRFQGTEEDDRVEEQPGKIFHEHHDELDARLIESEMPFKDGRSYAGFDETFLFVTTVKRFRDAFPDHPIVARAWPHVERAVEWIDHYADDDGDGLYEYRRRNPANLLNQVWKDSYDCVTHAGFDVPPHPLAWIEVQGYAYQALLDAADMYAAREDARAGGYRKRAAALREQVDRQFWLERHACYAIVLDGRKKPVAMVSSNAAHALWGGIVPPERAPVLITRLMQPDMLTAYGLRTLSAESGFYAPFAYHRGSVWPFDCGAAVAGLLRYGADAAARKVMEGVSAALLTIGSALETYAALDPGHFVTPIGAGTDREILAYRQVKVINRTQGFTAGAMVFFAAKLAQMTGATLPDA